MEAAEGGRLTIWGGKNYPDESSEIHSKKKEEEGRKEEEEDERLGRRHVFTCFSVMGEDPATNKAPLEEASH